MGHKDYSKSKNNAENDCKKRFFVDDATIGLVNIRGDEHNHLANVMRYKVGDLIILICDDEFDYYGKIVEIKKEYTVVDVFEKKKNTANPTIEVTAFVAMNKREQMSMMIRMLSEIGVTNFVPIITKYTLPKDTTEKIERFQKIADQSAKQCRRSLTLKILPPKKIEDIYLTFNQFDAVFFAYENEEKLTLKQINENYKKIAFIVGPVAGFDQQEANEILKHGAISISLGKRILREETACVAIASNLIEKYENN